MEKMSELFRKCAWEVEYKNIGHGVSYAFVPKGKTLYIYFQGSSELVDWFRNFLFPAKPYKDMEIPYRVHRGFLAAWKEVEDLVIEKITEKELHDEVEDFKWKEIIVVGYSHGAALSGLCHECCWYWRPDLRESNLHGFGFESPRFYAGWHVKKSLKPRWQNYLVIRTNNDLVTRVPPWILRYCHVGSMLKIKGDVTLVKNRLPKCIKSHFPEVVYDALIKYEQSLS